MSATALIEKEPPTAGMAEDEIRPDRLMPRSFELLEEDTRRLMADRDQFVDVGCPACGLRERERYCQKRGMEFELCLECGTVYGTPRPTPARLARYYQEAKYYDYWNQYIYPQSESARREKVMRPRVERILEICRKHGASTDRLLEVGAGSGLFCEVAAASGHFRRVVAVEPTPGSARQCEARGLEVIRSPIETVAFDEGRASVIVAFEVVEHLFSPDEFVKKCARLLEPGGLLVLTCPNIEGFDVDLLREAADTVTPEHLNYFNPRSLPRLTEGIGLETLEVSTPGKLDVDIVRKKALAGWDAALPGVLKRVVLGESDALRARFQSFLAENGLSSHMWLVARRPSNPGMQMEMVYDKRST